MFFEDICYIACIPIWACAPFQGRDLLQEESRFDLPRVWPLSRCSLFSRMFWWYPIYCMQIYLINIFQQMIINANLTMILPFISQGHLAVLEGLPVRRPWQLWNAENVRLSWTVEPNQMTPEMKYGSLRLLNCWLQVYSQTPKIADVVHIIFSKRIFWLWMSVHQGNEEDTTVDLVSGYSFDLSEFPPFGTSDFFSRIFDYSRMRSEGSRFTWGSRGEAVFAKFCVCDRNRSQPSAVTP